MGLIRRRSRGLLSRQNLRRRRRAWRNLIISILLQTCRLRRFQRQHGRLKGFNSNLRVHKIEIFLASILKFVLFLYKLCENIKILLKKFFDQAIFGGDTIFPLSLRLSGIEFSLV